MKPRHNIEVSSGAVIAGLLCFVIVLVVISAMLPSSRPPPKSNGEQVITREAFGCASMENFDELGRIAATGDDIATKRFFEEHDCRSFAKGEQAFLEDASWKGVGCLRPKGETTCYWLVLSSFETAR